MRRRGVAALAAWPLDVVLAALRPTHGRARGARCVGTGGGDAGTPRPARRQRGGVRIAVVTHGQASSPFWAIVRNGVEAAARQMDVLVTYRAPDIYSLDRMEALDRPGGGRAGPTGSWSRSPSPAWRRRSGGRSAPASRSSRSTPAATSSGALGVLAHVGQPEDRAGLQAGRRLARGGRAPRAVRQPARSATTALDARCRGLADAMREAGGHVRTWSRVDDQSPRRREPDRRRRSRAHDADGVLTLNATRRCRPRRRRARGGRNGQVLLGTFDLAPDVLKAVRAGQDRASPIDQQAYLQGYLPVVLLAQRARYGLFPAQGDVIATGPNFVTRDNAAQAIALSERVDPLARGGPLAAPRRTRRRAAAPAVRRSGRRRPCCPLAPELRPAPPRPPPAVAVGAPGPRGGLGGEARHRELAVEVELARDRVDVVRLVGEDEGDADAGAPGAAGRPDAVDVVLAGGRGVEVDDVRDVVDVDAAGGDVGGDERVDLARVEAAQRLLALALGLVAVHGGARPRRGRAGA